MKKIKLNIEEIKIHDSSTLQMMTKEDFELIKPQNVDIFYNFFVDFDVSILPSNLKSLKLRSWGNLSMVSKKILQVEKLILRNPT